LGARGDTTTILCSQPRRVAAISVAERVSDEMFEDSVGRLVGYQIRLESRRSSETRLLFCTTGVILRRLVEDPTLKGISHVIVDEVHERQWQIDVLLVSLRALLQGTRSDLKVVLVSFHSEIESCPMRKIFHPAFPPDVSYS
jgi:ATP-dependent RNA helicase DHX36